MPQQCKPKRFHPARDQHTNGANSKGDANRKEEEMRDDTSSGRRGKAKEAGANRKEDDTSSGRR